MRRVFATMGAWLMLSGALAVSAQPAPSSGGRIAFDATLGLGHGAGGDATIGDRGMTSVATLLARRLFASPRSHALAAVAIGAELNFSDLVCIAELDQSGPLRGCRSYPSPAYLSALAGWTTHGAQDRGGRVFAGPAYTENGFGILTRADASAPIAKHVSFVWRGQALFGPRDVTRRLQVYSWGMGLRVQ